MKAIVVNEAGGPEVLQYTDIPKPAMKPGWTRVKVVGFGINHSEVFTRNGLSPDVKFPRVLGIEVVGTVDETTDPDSLHPGQTVVSLMGEMGRAFDGSYAEYVLLPNQQVYPVTTKLSWSDLAAVPETYYTAFGIVKSLQIKAHDRVLIRAATSGVGVAALKLIKAMGIPTKVVGTTRSSAKTENLKQCGLDSVIVTKNSVELPADSGKFDKIIDLIGPASVPDSFKHLNEFGIVSATGELGGQWYLDQFDPITNIPNNCYLTGFYSGNVSGELIQEMITYLEDNKVDVTPTKIFDLAHTRQAHEYLASSKGLGKVVVMIDKP